MVRTIGKMNYKQFNPPPGVNCVLVWVDRDGDICYSWRDSILNVGAWESYIHIDIKKDQIIDEVNGFRVVMAEASAEKAYHYGDMLWIPQSDNLRFC
jgi:hypothetical protein